MSELYPYQREGVDRLKELGRALLADQMGLGKTVSILTVIDELDAYPALVVCPASLKINWKREISKHLGLNARVLSGTKPERQRGGEPKFTVINYDVLSQRLPELVGKFKCVVADEGHYLQSRSAKRTKAVKQLMRGVDLAYVLTGTPIGNRPADIWAILNMLRPTTFSSFMAFCQRYAKPRKMPWGWTFDGAKNLDELYEVLTREIMVRRLKSQVLKDLPAKRRITVPLEMENRKQYEGAKGDFISWLVKNRPDKLSGAARAEGLQKANHLKQLVGKLKIPSVVAWATDFLEESGEKLILFAYHREVVERLAAAFGKAAVKVYGGTSEKQRQLAFDSFNDSSAVRVLVGQVEAAGQGWSCRSTATCAFAELDWRPSIIDQACDRTHGIGRGIEGSISTSYFLLADESVEEALASAIERKQKIARAALDGGEGEVLDIFTEFCRILRGKG